MHTKLPENTKIKPTRIKDEGIVVTLPKPHKGQDLPLAAHDEVTGHVLTSLTRPLPVCASVD